MRNFVQPGHTLTVPAPADIKSGDVAIIGAIAGIASGDALTGEPLDVSTSGVFELPKVSALAIAVGDIVYFDGAAKLVTKTAAGNSKLGYATAAAANPSGTVNVKLVSTV